jgi:hypothetical protein
VVFWRLFNQPTWQHCCKLLKKGFRRGPEPTFTSPADWMGNFCVWFQEPIKNFCFLSWCTCVCIVMSLQIRYILELKIVLSRKYNTWH